MKKLLIILMALLVAVLAAPVFAAEPAGPPGTDLLITIFAEPLQVATVQAPKEVASVCLDAIAVSTYYETIDVVPVYLRPVPGLAADPAMCTSAKPMLAGLMYGARLPSMTDTDAEAYVMLMASGAPFLTMST